MTPPAGFADLDTLAATVRDAEAKRHFAEAVACYNAGAHRAAVVSAWTSCVYDIVSKIRELALSGDKDAEAEQTAFEKIAASNDVSASLQFERGVLDLARDKFTLLNHQEHADLVRLREDRHRCAHPAMNSAEEPYRPSPELVRYHLHSAAMHLLIRPPVQGKAALDRLLAQISSEYFPEKVDLALTVLKQGPLARAKISLVRNLIVATMKALTNGTWPPMSPSTRRAVSALDATLRLYPLEAKTILEEESPRLVRNVKDEHLLSLLRLVEAIPSLSAALPTDMTLRMEAYIRGAPAADRVAAILWALDTPLFAGTATLQAASLSRVEAAEAALRGLPRLKRHRCVLDRCFELYMASGSWEAANDIASKVILKIVDSLTVQQIERLVREAGTHHELAGAHTTPAVLRRAREGSAMSTAAFDALAIEVRLGDDFSDVLPTDTQAEEEDSESTIE